MGNGLSLKKPNKDRLFDSMTPRQKRAIGEPIISLSEMPDPTHQRINGNVQSILTFDLEKISTMEDPTEGMLERAVDGYYATWHGRVATYPVQLLDDWDRLTIAKAEGIIMRLVSSVGLQEGREIHNGSDLKSIHVYKWATTEELRLCEKFLGKTFVEMYEGGPKPAKDVS